MEPLVAGGAPPLTARTGDGAAAGTGPGVAALGTRVGTTSCGAMERGCRGVAARIVEAGCGTPLPGRTPGIDRASRRAGGAARTGAVARALLLTETKFACTGFRSENAGAATAVTAPGAFQFA